MISGRLPVLALRGMTVFPSQNVHFDVGRKKSVLALEQAMNDGQYIFLIPQKDIMDDDPSGDKLYSVGTVAKIKQILKPQGETVRVLVNGICRGRITELTKFEPYLEADVQAIAESEITDNPRNHALCREAVTLYGTYLEMSEFPARSVHLRMLSSTNPGFLADCIAQNSGMDYPDKAKLLANMNPVRRLESALRLLRLEIEMLQLEGEIQSRTHANIDRNQREYYLREQMKVIREELGEEDEYSEFAEYEKKILLLNLDEASEKKLRKDLERLKKQPFGSAEAGVLRNYLDHVLDLPWHTRTKERVNVEAAAKVLDKEHYGLEKVKERIWHLRCRLRFSVWLALPVWVKLLLPIPLPVA